MEEDWENWTKLPHPSLHPRPQKGVFLSPGEAGFAGHIKTRRQRAERGCPRSPRRVYRRAAG